MTTWTCVPPRVFDPVVGAGERYISGGVHNSGDGHPVDGAILPHRPLLLIMGGGAKAQAARTSSGSLLTLTISHGLRYSTGASVATVMPR
jgi:hypothetical protein